MTCGWDEQGIGYSLKINSINLKEIYTFVNTLEVELEEQVVKKVLEAANNIFKI